jgi:hypothetical protein
MPPALMLEISVRSGTWRPTTTGLANRRDSYERYRTEGTPDAAHPVAASNKEQA